MAVAASLPPFRSPSPASSLSSFARSPSPSSPRIRASASPPAHHSPRAIRRPSIEPKEYKDTFSLYTMDPNKSPKLNGHSHASTNGYYDGQRKREGSVSSISEDEEAFRRRNRQARSPPAGVGTLPTIRANVEGTADEDPLHAPPPAPSAGAAHATVIGPDGQPVLRRRRSSSIKVKPPPGVTPQKAVDWEIPRKAFHSSIGFFTLVLYYLDPPTVLPLIKYLTVACAFIFTVDLIRLNSPAFAEIWEIVCGFLMRVEERNKINGVVWYLVGVIFVLYMYPRDIAVVSILTLSWSDTTASTLGRLWGRHTPPLPPHFPGIKFLPFAPRKSLAGFLAASVTGFLIGYGFWHNGSTVYHDWLILDSGMLGRIGTALVVGVGGAVVEALDLGVDDNLTLPILSGALIWGWFESTNYLLRL
ncbi:hypothetical protein CcaverHIS002_0109390 [Cutaneotrichosporon cavernicola]|uniref:Phosphatidate cytidylyltransferase n=1 Tax=Cutaneotrichosporon cavernicola TaxID=279322 RepID=A0AA48I2J6_9TREE|nr:uncharacterized protein CcaverHIS019_0109300 [Cutaneotrichosporon cavernicola]BEI80410.1 hypothetical protein CcaverHIS002_0109390 [Cutaneotrichosporon cavernicola]BEI88212.1 hypothetical protein CcaverHIS019_0109300 [Cutaneotrichosporon cavernicola]BEI95983.1 hypothetical protein CcaverHIS631_0109320 [Cutaneotrichosporon cavernicola]BEJ03757.1 hypothetical protein CcaverHIS641_0109320 [Cutaneotrichosporon cavernicola]